MGSVNVGSSSATPARKTSLPSPSLVYYLLSLPAVLLEVSFAAQVLAGLEGLVSLLGWLGDLAIPVAIMLPWLFPILSVYAVLALRPSLLVTLLTSSFFIFATGTGEAGILTVSLVVLVFFSSLIGFNHAREAKLLSGRKPNIHREGPGWTKIASLGLDAVLPFASALGLVSLVAYTIFVMKERVALMPEPLSTLGTAYLTSHVNLVFLVITTAGMLVWATRQALEPVIIWYTWTRDDAVEEAKSWIKRDVDKAAKMLGWRPKRTVPRSVYYLLLLLGLLVGSLGPAGIVDSLVSIFTLGFVNPAQGTWLDASVRGLDGWLVQLSNWLNAIAGLLWG